MATSHGIFLFEHKRLAEVNDQELSIAILLIDEVDVLLANQELKAKALRARAIVGLSATLGGSVGLQRYADHFAGSANYGWVLPGDEETIDLKLLHWDTWEKGPIEAPIPYLRLVQLI